MPIITVGDNENNRWNRNVKKSHTHTQTQRQERIRWTEAIVKRSELNDFAVRLN